MVQPDIYNRRHTQKVMSRKSEEWLCLGAKSPCGSPLVCGVADVRVHKKEIPRWLTDRG